MPRKLNTYVTTSGFYELAVAAPSMKAALEIWGSKRNLFHQGFAAVSEDPAIVAATLKEPGTVLKRAVGEKGAFRKNAPLPSLSPLQKALTRKAPAPHRAVKKVNKRRTPNVGEATDRKAAQLYDLAEKRREKEQARADAEERRERERCERVTEKAQATLDEARADHESRMAALNSEAEALERRKDRENERWNEVKEKLEGALDRARD